MKLSSILKTITQRSSGQGLLLSTLPTNNYLQCGICKERFDIDHFPVILCKNNHLACKKCIDLQFSQRSQSSPNKINQRKCFQCNQKYSKQTLRPFRPYLDLCQYIRKLQQISKKQQTRYQLKLIQTQQISKQLKKENLELKKWIKEVSQKLREIQVGKKWNITKNSDFRFQIVESDKTQKGIKNSTFQINQGIIKKACVGSFANIVGLQPIPKTGIHLFSVKLISSLSGGSILYGLCTNDAKNQRFPWLTQGFIGYSGNDGDVVTSGSWSNTSTIYYDGTKVRPGDTLVTIVDIDNKIINWKIGNDFVTESYVIPQKMRNKLLFPMVIFQDGDLIQIVQNS